MKANETNIVEYRVLLVITTPKIAVKAEKLFASSGVLLHYMSYAMGTAPNEMLDILGLGTPDKSALISFLPKDFADKLMLKMYRELKFSIPGNGIAFTLPISAAGKHAIRMVDSLVDKETKLSERKEENKMSKTQRVMIAAAVNHGYSEEVMNAAREAGAGGGTVVHGRRVGDKTVMSIWGMGVQEEKEIVLIVADSDSKTKIMQEISSKCGMHSDAKGMVFALPIDSVVGLGELE